MAGRELSRPADQVPDAPSTPPAARFASAALAALLTLVPVVVISGALRGLGLLLLPQFLAVVLALALALIFVTVRADRSSGGRPPLHDLGAAAAALAAGGWAAVRFPYLTEVELFYHLEEGLAVALPILLLVIEGLRRVTGWPLVIVTLAFLAYGLTAHLMPGDMRGLYTRPDDLARYLALDTNALFGLPLTIGATVVISFVMFGQLLNRSGGGAFITDFSAVLMGRTRGGSAKIAIVASSLFGTVSGSAVANVASTGVVTIPLMRRAGYPAPAAGGIEAVASTGGQLMPPVMGAAAFLMSELLVTDYRNVVIAALVPALLYYLALFVAADLDAARHDIRGVDGGVAGQRRRVLALGGHFFIPFAVLIYALFALNLRAEVAALYGSAAVMLGGGLIGYRGTRLGLRAFWEAIVGTGMAMRDLVMIVAAAGLVIGVMNKTGLATALTLTLVQFAGGDVVVLLLIAALTGIILGMGMPTVGVYILLATLVAPSLIELGIAPMAAHLYVLYFGLMSMITPPIAIAAFAAASIAEAEPMRTGLNAVRYGWAAYVMPFVFVASPELLLDGEILSILAVVATTGAGVWLVSVAVAGYFAGPLGGAVRGGFLVAGMALLLPHDLFAAADWLNGAGAAFAAALVLGRRVRRA